MEYREPNLPDDWGKQCEFSEDGKTWTSSKLLGYCKINDSDHVSWSDGLEYYRHARIAVEQPKPELPEGFIAWHGGECPVNKDAVVGLMFRDGDVFEKLSRKAGCYRWQHDGTSSDIIGYKIIEPAYRPFANAEEFDTHSGKSIVFDDEPKTRQKIGRFDDIYVFIRSATYTYQFLLDHAKFADGSRIGVEVK